MKFEKLPRFSINLIESLMEAQQKSWQLLIESLANGAFNILMISSQICDFFFRF